MMIVHNYFPIDLLTSCHFLKLVRDEYSYAK